MGDGSGCGLRAVNLRVGETCRATSEVLAVVDWLWLIPTHQDELAGQADILLGSVVPSKSSGSPSNQHSQQICLSRSSIIMSRRSTYAFMTQRGSFMPAPRAPCQCWSQLDSMLSLELASMLRLYFSMNRAIGSTLQLAATWLGH
jgi:hypothetical protein